MWTKALYILVIIIIICEYNSVMWNFLVEGDSYCKINEYIYTSIYYVCEYSTKVKTNIKYQHRPCDETCECISLKCVCVCVRFCVNVCVLNIACVYVPPIGCVSPNRNMCVFSTIICEAFIQSGLRYFSINISK